MLRRRVGSGPRASQRGKRNRRKSVLGCRGRSEKQGCHDLGASERVRPLAGGTRALPRRPQRLGFAPAVLHRPLPEHLSGGSGGIDKTLHALSYLDDEEQRRRILSQLNRGQAWLRAPAQKPSPACAGWSLVTSHSLNIRASRSRGGTPSRARQATQPDPARPRPGRVRFLHHRLPPPAAWNLVILPGPD